jgi:hypothetical protein
MQAIDVNRLTCVDIKSGMIACSKSWNCGFLGIIGLARSGHRWVPRTGADWLVSQPQLMDVALTDGRITLEM